MKPQIALALTLTSTLALAQAPPQERAAPADPAAGSVATTPVGASAMMPSEQTPPPTATMGGPADNIVKSPSQTQRSAMRSERRSPVDDWNSLTFQGTGP